MINREYFYRQIQNPEDKLIIARILDKAEETLRDHEPKATGFLDPYQQVLASKMAQGLTSVGFFFNGGYPEAERKRLIFHPDYLAKEFVESEISLLSIKGNFKFQQVTHRDFLGGIMSLGLQRDKIGDIVLQPEGGAQIIVDPTVTDYLKLNLTKIHHLTVKVVELPWDKLNLPEEKVKIIKATVPSLRLDAVAGEGFGESRSQLTKEILAGNVKLNWFETTDCAHKIEIGDVISIRKKGRIVVDDITGTSKKGRIGLLLKRYL